MSEYAETYICTGQYDEVLCDECGYKNYEMVSHPGGDPYHSVEKCWCENGHWEDDF